MSDDEKNIMIGDLLVRSGLISSADLTEAMQVSRRLGMPMGRVLTMDGRISPDIFQLALEAQSLIRDGVVPPDVGIEALGIAARDRQPIAEALKRMDRHPQASSGSTNRLGELLVDANIITTDQLNQALKISVESGLPLGGTLVTQGIIHASLLPTVLRAQEQIRDGVLPRDAAIEELKAAMKIWAKAEAAMKRTDYAVEQPLKPSSVMSTLRDTLEGVAPRDSYAQPQSQHQTPAPMPMPVHPPAQHQPSSLHAQLQQQQQQYYQNQQQQQQPQAHPQALPMQHQQTQPMQMPQHMQQPMPQHMQQPMPQHMQQQQMQQPMPQHMQQLPPQQMPQPMPQQVPAPIYGYNTPYGHAPYGGPTPDDPWGSWHGTVPRHQGLGVPLPGFPQPPTMPPEGYAPPPGYPAQQGQQMPPQGAPQQQNWNAPPPNLPIPPQHVQPQPSSLHAQLQQQQHLPQNQYPLPNSQPGAAQPTAQYSAPAPVAPPQPEIGQQQLQNSGQHSTPVALHDSAQHVRSDVATAKQELQENDPLKDGAGQLKNAAAQLASRLGWAAPKGGDGDAQADLPSPKKLSWTQPQPASAAKSETPQPLPAPAPEPTPAPKPVTAPMPEPEPSVPAPVQMPASAPVPVPTPPVAQAPVTPPSPVAEAPKPVETESKQESLGDYKPDWSSPASAPSPVAEFKGPSSTPAATPFAAPQGASASPSLKETNPANDVAQVSASDSIDPPAKFEIKLELPAEKDKVESQEDDDEPDFKMELDLDLPAPFNKQPDKPVEVLVEKSVAPIVETPRPGQIAGFGKGTKISLKSDYAPNETGRLFSITQAEALTLLSDDPSFDTGEEKKDSPPSKGKKGKGKASQSQTKLTKQAKGKKGQAGKSQTGLQSVKESESPPSWLPQKNQNHSAAMLGQRAGEASVPDFIEDLLPVAKVGPDMNKQFGDIDQTVAVPGGKASNTQSKMASIKQRAVSLSLSNLLPVPIEIAEAQAELAYIVEHRGAPAVPPVTFTPQPPQPPQPETPATIVELLTLSGFFTKKDIATALDKALEDASLAPDLLMALGLVADDTLDVAVRCQTLVRNRYLRTEQAIYVLGAVRSGRLSFEAALSEIGK
ncbi:MAG: hypothetical protein C0469_16415 [Cyanobacteria bacterium DS2.3.42]|nr:hypothetical protein [Cyanobacteria bacterium DS2.3.42]